MDRLNLRLSIFFLPLTAVLFFMGCQQLPNGVSASPSNPQASISEPQALPAANTANTTISVTPDLQMLQGKDQVKVHVKSTHRRTHCLKEVHIKVASVEFRKRGHEEDRDFDNENDRDHKCGYEGKFEHRESDRCESRLTQRDVLEDLDIEGHTSGVPPGDYTQLRLKLSEAWATLDDDSIVELKVPSGSESGLKVMLNHPLQIRDGNEFSGLPEEIYIEFDFSRSFVFRGHTCSAPDNDGVILKPVVRGEVVSTTGTLQGTVQSDEGTAGFTDDDQALAGAIIEVQAGGVVVTTTQADANGAYSIPALAEGTYDLVVSADQHSTQTVTGISISAGVSTAQDILLSMVSSGGGTVAP